MISFRLTTLVIILTGTVASGCQFSATPTSPKQPLVVDLTAVARALGRDEVMQQKLDDAYQQLNIQLTEIGSKLEKQLEGKKATLKKGAADKKKELDKLALQANAQLRQTQQLAREKGALYRVQLVNEFRQEVLGVAKQIAEQRGAASVVVANSDLLWYASPLDITDEVIGALRAQPTTQPGSATGADQPATAAPKQTAKPDPSTPAQDTITDGTSS